MNNKKLTILAGLAVAMLAWAIIISSVSKKSSQDFSTPQYLIGNIEPSLISSITISTGDDLITLDRDGKRFVLQNKDGYPADTGQINDLINTCIDIQTLQLYTEDASNHADLGVVEESARTAVRFLKADGTLLAGVIIGRTKTDGSGTYIRRPEEDQVYVTEGNPQIRTGEMGYLDQQLTSSINSDDIESVTVSSPDGSYSLSLDADGKIVANNLPVGGELDESKAEAVLAALSGLRFNDVSKDDHGLDFNNIYICNKKDLSVYSIQLANTDEKAFIKCSAIFEGTLPGKSRNVESPEVLAKKEALYLANDEIKKFANMTRGWIYEISKEAAENLTKPITDLLVEPEISEDQEPTAESLLEMTQP